MKVLCTVVLVLGIIAMLLLIINLIRLYKDQIEDEKIYRESMKAIEEKFERQQNGT